jgi:hypothetical protein
VSESTLNEFMEQHDAHVVVYNLDLKRWEFITPVHKEVAAASKLG